MGYKFWCKDCGHNYYTVGSGTWYKSGSVTRYPSYGYCSECCGHGYTSWTWSGNVVKLECCKCSNKIGIVSWYDWKNRSGERTGYCSGCYNSYKQKKEREERERQRREEEERERARQQRENDAKNKAHYCPKSYSFTAPNWANVEHEIDSYNYLWSKCIIRCKAKDHTIYRKNNFDEYKNINCNRSSWLRAEIGNEIHEAIIKILNNSECSRCADDIKQAAAAETRKENARNKVTEIDGKFKKYFPEQAEDKKDPDTDPSDPDDIKNKIKELDEFEKDIDAAISEFTDITSEASAIPQENNKILNELSQKNTYTDEKELEGDIQKLKDKRQKIAKVKKQLEEKEKNLIQKQNDIIDKENKINEERKKINDELLKGKGKKAKIDEIKKDLANASISAKDGGKSLEILTDKINNIANELEVKYIGNEKAAKDLNDARGRIGKIRGKLMAQQSECKYLGELLNDEMNRLSNATDDAMDKFEKRTTYFLAVDLGLNDEVIDKFTEAGFEYEDIVEITDQELMEDVEIDDAKLRKKILRLIKNYKRKSK